MVAFIVPAKGADIKAIKRQVQEKIVSYMIPKVIYIIHFLYLLILEVSSFKKEVFF